MGRSAEKAIRAEERAERLKRLAEDIARVGEGDAAEMLKVNLREAAGRRPGLREMQRSWPSDRFSERFAFGGGAEGLRLAITEGQFNSLQGIFGEARCGILLSKHRVAEIKFEYGSFRIKIGEATELVDLEGAQIRVEYLKGGEAEAIEALEEVRNSFESVIGYKKEEQGQKN